ncbi:hypothetical protein [Elizabethkingia anophelis]|uniref:GIY-YIG domain-containing protein n=2 Tax=Elizabethkingia anophelis TaxID=1117645 RepID=A0A455ZF13_9FLAO|nr:hypothetical protein [Elizabethkingia anophelis]AIL46975.1 hypothetical protein BD94_3200 [Elizabethkingia anophelis NUHP1]DAC75427.1 TPA_exp: hypothetical protein [Elizabethkingia anophelis]
MKLDTVDILGQSEKFLLKAARQISKITINPLAEVSFHSSEFRNKVILKDYSDKIPQSKRPLIYIISLQTKAVLPALIRNFEEYHRTNIQRTKNVDRVNLARHNKTASKVLYVGSSTTDFRTRIKNHLGTEGIRTYSMHLCKWDNGLDYNLNISAFELIGENTEKIDRFLVEIIEQQFWEELRPVFGKKSGL